MECFAGYLSHADAQIGRVLAFLDELGERDDTLVMVVSDNGASAEGGAQGSINDARLTNLDPGRSPRAAPAHRRDRWAQHPQQLPVGLDHGRQHPVPPLEARGARGRGGRSVHRQLAGPPGPGGRHRSATSSPTPSTWSPRCSSWPGSRRPDQIVHVPQAPDRRHQLRLPARRPTAPARPGATTRSTSRCSGRGPSTTTAGRRSPSSRSAPCTTTAATGWRPSTRTPGSCTASPPTCPRCTTWPPSTPSGWPNWSSCGGPRPGPHQVLPLDNRVLYTILNPRPSRLRDRTRYRYHPHGAPVPEAVAVDVRNRTHSDHGGRHLRGRDPRPTACCWPSARCWAAGRCTCSTAACATSTTSTASRWTC